MNIAIVVGLFCLISCLHFQADGAVFRGKTKDCSIRPAAYKRTCHRYDCDEKTGDYTIYTCGVSTVTCPKGQIADLGREDLTKEYPACCPRPSCRKA